MPKTLIKSRLQSIKHKPKIKQEKKKTKSYLPPHLQPFTQNFLPGSGFFSIYMSLEDFQLLGNELFDKRIIKREFLKVYHQQGAQLNQESRNIEFRFGENNNYHEIGNSY